VGQLVDTSDGTIAARYEYDPYGNLTDLGGAYVDANAYRFSTKYFDSETSLYYYGYRYYSHELGRWINRDPFEENGGDNLHGFIENMPCNLFDAFGQVAQKAGEILIEITRTNVGKHSTIGVVDVSSKGFDSFLGVSLELKSGKYNLKKGEGTKNYPIPSGEYKGSNYRMFGSFAVKLVDKKNSSFDKLRLHIGTFPWNSEGCILIGNYFQVNYHFTRSSPGIYRTLSEDEWDVFTSLGMITKDKIALKYKTQLKKPGAKIPKKYESSIWDQNGLTDRLYESTEWFAKLEKYYKAVVKKHGKSCVSFKVSVN
jgi:RHS repeat-associated protein